MTFDDIRTMIAKANEAGQWIYASGAWYSPEKALRILPEYDKPPVHWRRRDPQEHVNELMSEVTRAQGALDCFEGVLLSWRQNRQG